jgi:hypothetical protein
MPTPRDIVAKRRGASSATPDNGVERHWTLARPGAHNAGLEPDPWLAFQRVERHAMTNSTSGKSPDSAFDGIDFELTDISDARKALDDLPPGVGELERHMPGYWEKRRQSPSAADRALTGRALEWLVQLPPALRPTRMSQRFPRLVNALATVWGDAPRALAAIDNLLVDRRGGRQGLPEDVQSELKLLLEHLKRSASAAPPAARHAPVDEALTRARALLEAAGYRVIPPAG